MNKWIDVNDRLPEEEVDVLVAHVVSSYDAVTQILLIDETVIAMAYVVDGDWWLSQQDMMERRCKRVANWMPKPDLPEVQP